MAARAENDPETKPGATPDRGGADRPKEPTHAPGEDALPGRRGPEPYPVNDPELTDPTRTPGAEPDVTPVRPGRLGTM